MAQGQIRRAWTEGGRAWMTVAVAENPADPTAETNWTGSVAFDAAFQALTASQKRAALIAAVKAVRDASVAPARVDLGIDGGVPVVL
jgi:hypothetical protein